MKKKLLAVLLVCTLASSLTLLGCSSTELTTVTRDGFSFQIDSTWEEEVTYAGTYIFSYTYQPTTAKGNPKLQLDEFEHSIYSERPTRAEQLEYLHDDFVDDGLPEYGFEMRFSNIREGSFGSNAFISADVGYYLDGELLMQGKKAEFFVTSTLQVSILYTVDSSSYKQYKKDIQRVIDSIKPV
ncbi:MAG: hypothetical protein FWD43_04375 [Coriobacteriia bacterium]|nr:hypothetical protein [Coriobacteriia bacterium]